MSTEYSVKEVRAEEQNVRAYSSNNPGAEDEWDRNADMLAAYAATLRQQAERGDGVVSDEVVERASAIYFGDEWPDVEDVELCRISMREALEAVAPLLRDGDYWRGRLDERNAQKATKELLRAHAEQGGRVDAADAAEKWLQSTARKAGPHGVSADQESMMRLGFVNGYGAALAQNAQGEAVAWMCETVNGYTAFSRDGKFPCNAGKISPLYLHAERARVPDGWGLKPSKATGDMVLAGIHENLSDPGPNVFNRIWAAMFAAAPSQPEGAESGA